MTIDDDDQAEDLVEFSAATPSRVRLCTHMPLDTQEAYYHMKKDVSLVESITGSPAAHRCLCGYVCSPMREIKGSTRAGLQPGYSPFGE